jgi:hypothetical protein
MNKVKTFKTVGDLREAIANEDDETLLSLSIETPWKVFDHAQIVKIEQPREMDEPVTLMISAMST